MRPVLENLTSYEVVFADPPVLDICDIATMNDYLDIRAENEYRIRKAYEAHLAANKG